MSLTTRESVPAKADSLEGTDHVTWLNATTAQVLGDHDLYTVRCHGNAWTCECPWFVARGPARPCSHVLASQKALRTGGGLLATLPTSHPTIPAHLRPTRPEPTLAQRIRAVCPKRQPLPTRCPECRGAAVDNVFCPMCGWVNPDVGAKAAAARAAR